MHGHSTDVETKLPPSSEVRLVAGSIEARSPFYQLVAKLKSFDQALVPDDCRETYALCAWGPTSGNSRKTALELRTLLSAPWLRLATTKGGQLEALGLYGVAQEWCRLFNHGIDPGIASILHDLALSIEPETAFVGLGSSMLDFVKRVCPPDAKTQLQFFMCLSRIAAYQCDGEVRWHSEWLRGTKAHPRAIPGASSNARMLDTLLKLHVLEKVEGQRFSKAATYRLKVDIKTGSISNEQAAGLLNVKWRRCRKLGNDPLEFQLGAA